MRNFFKVLIAVCLLTLLWLLSTPLQIFSSSSTVNESLNEQLHNRMSKSEILKKMPVNYITVNDVQRSYFLFLPSSYSPKNKYPLLINLHGGGGNANNAEKVSSMLPIAENKGIIVVYPNGTGRFKHRLLTWNAGNCCSYALENQIDDVNFIRQLIVALEKQYSIDPKRIYATGLSNGGMLTYRLGCELSDKLAAISPVAAAMNVSGCYPDYPVSLIVFHGTADRHVPYNGGSVAEKRLDKKNPRTDRSVSDSVGFWVKYNQCSATPVQTNKGHIIKTQYVNCKNKTGVTLYTITDGGHSWPGGFSWGGDSPTQEISASNLMIDFFLSHPKP